MKIRFSSIVLVLFCGLLWFSAHAAYAASYKPLKVVYDVAVDNTSALENVLARASHLSIITGADPMEGSIIIVLHGPEVAFFVKDDYEVYKNIVDRAKSLSVGGIIKIMMSELALNVRGLSSDNIPKFIKIVPFGDAEIARLQAKDGHAYINAGRNLAP
ncbi:MAG: DsrE family protein [Pseudomonadota bacterium]